MRPGMAKRETKLTERQQALMDALRIAGGESNDFHLACELGTPRSAIRGMLRRLEDKGLVELVESRGNMGCGGSDTFVSASLVKCGDAQDARSGAQK